MLFELEKDHNMIETRCLRNIVIFLSRKILYIYIYYIYIYIYIYYIYMCMYIYTFINIYTYI